VTVLCSNRHRRCQALAVYNTGCSSDMSAESNRSRHYVYTRHMDLAQRLWLADGTAEGIARPDTIASRTGEANWDKIDWRTLRQDHFGNLTDVYSIAIKKM